MRGAQLLALPRDLDTRGGDRRFDLLAARADHDDAARRPGLVQTVDQVDQHRPPGDRVQHLVQIGLHARTLARGKDDDGERTGHGDVACHGRLAISIGRRHRRGL